MDELFLFQGFHELLILRWNRLWGSLLNRYKLWFFHCSLIAEHLFLLCSLVTSLSVIWKFIECIFIFVVNIFWHTRWVSCTSYELGVLYYIAIECVDTEYFIVEDLEILNLKERRLEILRRSLNILEIRFWSLMVVLKCLLLIFLTVCILVRVDLAALYWRLGGFENLFLLLFHIFSFRICEGLRFPSSASCISSGNCCLISYP